MESLFRAAAGGGSCNRGCTAESCAEFAAQTAALRCRALRHVDRSEEPCNAHLGDYISTHTSGVCCSNRGRLQALQLGIWTDPNNCRNCLIQPGHGLFDLDVFLCGSLVHMKTCKSILTFQLQNFILLHPYAGNFIRHLRFCGSRPALIYHQDKICVALCHCIYSHQKAALSWSTGAFIEYISISLCAGRRWSCCPSHSC